jgi:hypothetical protein
LGQTTKKTQVASIVARLLVVHCCVFIRCHSNSCQHMPYCLQHARHNIISGKQYKLWSSL